MLRRPNQIAVVDIGSYSVRLVIFSLTNVKKGGFPQVIFNEKIICKLAHHMNTTGVMAEDAIQRALAALTHYAEVIARHGITVVYPLATAAVRDARNGGDFVKMAEKVLGVPLRVLSGSCEATYAGLATLGVFPYAEGIVGDLGGGSLDMSRLYAHTVHHAQSLPLGHLRLAEYLACGEDVYSIVNEAFSKLTWLHERETPVFYAIGGRWRELGQLFWGKKKSGALEKPIHAEDLGDFITADLLTRKRYRSEPVYPAAVLMQVVLDVIQPADVYIMAHSVRDGFLIAEGFWRPE